MNGDLQYIMMDEGRLLPNSDGTFTYEYNLRDHLGNMRVVFSTIGNGVAQELQNTHNYLFGITMEGIGYDAYLQHPEIAENKYLYNGKEFQTDYNLNWYDYRYRYYDPVICRFMSVDRLADKYPYKTPYDFAENRPISGTDLDGLEFMKAISGVVSPRLARV